MKVLLKFSLDKSFIKKIYRNQYYKANTFSSENNKNIKTGYE